MIMPGASLSNPFTEYFMVQNRSRVDNDYYYPTDGLVIWHILATLTTGNYFMYNNSYTPYKLVRLMEADGLEEIEKMLGANAGDFYIQGKTFSRSSLPNSDTYTGQETRVTVEYFPWRNHHDRRDFY